MHDLTFGIIGFGKMGKIRYNTLNKLQGCKVTWICDVNPDIQFPERVKYSNNANDLLENNDIDAIIVSTPNNVLKDLVIMGLDNKKHVFCEKPPGRNLAELKEMVSAEKRNPGLKLMFGFNHRHHESIIYAKQLVDSGDYGEILWMRGRYGKSVDESFFSNWRSKKEIAGGGIFLDQGIHMLDLFLMMCGDFEEVKSYVSNLYWKLEIEDNIFAIFRNKKGQVAQLHSTMTQWRHLFSFEIFLERGYITINGLKTPSNSYGPEAMSVAQNRTPPPAATWTREDDIIFSVDNSWRRELETFAESIKNNKKVPVGNTEDALKLMRLVDKIYKQK
jgi:predicted dehydrogenase